MQIDAQKRFESDFLPISVVAERLSLSRQTVYTLVNDGALNVHLFGGARRISKQDLERFIEDSKR